jgi:hypothetical protein
MLVESGSKDVIRPDDTRKNEMKLKNLAVWGFSFAGVLYVIAGLRDIFAPGVLRISPQNPSRIDIVIQFALAGIFFALAALTRIGRGSGGAKCL